MDTPWVGFDLDRTLAVYHEWRGTEEIGAPIPDMVARLKQYRRQGVEVRILTARVSHPAEAERARRAIEAWSLEHLGEVLPVTDRKDFAMLHAYDDRIVQVEPNTGRLLRDSLMTALLNYGDASTQARRYEHAMETAIQCACSGDVERAVFVLRDALDGNDEEVEDDEEDGCPVADPSCVSADGECHDACEPPSP